MERIGDMGTKARLPEADQKKQYLQHLFGIVPLRLSPTPSMIHPCAFSQFYIINLLLLFALHCFLGLNFEWDMHLLDSANTTYLFLHLINSIGYEMNSARPDLTHQPLSTFIPLDYSWFLEVWHLHVFLYIYIYSSSSVLKLKPPQYEENLPPFSLTFLP